MKYTFGTGNEAASRLGEIAKFFDPLATDLVRAYMPKASGVAVDLGCGPGFTTEMLARASGARQVYGLDNSREFLALARKRLPKCRFVEHDVTTIPFPVKADLMYARFLLSHLRDPVDVVNRWITQLSTGGRLVIEETEAVESEVDLFRIYLSTNDALVASQGARLFVGETLAAGGYDAEVLHNVCSVLPVPDRQAATWFLPNTLTIWRTSELVRGRPTARKAGSRGKCVESFSGGRALPRFDVQGGRICPVQVVLCAVDPVVVSITAEDAKSRKKHRLKDHGAGRVHGPLPPRKTPQG
jgi:SAM-dependent methyltransferase